MQARDSCYLAYGEGMICPKERSMRHRPANSPLSPAQSAALDWFLAAQGLGFNLAQDRAAREAVLAHLEALPDGALRAMGLRRNALPEHVYSDILSKGQS
ncbi:MAG: hypothetical protein EA386_11715 [Rhodobacteraceae bacterium]|nr:MAG: hypothetical protein EA386_11715 [Paracoccaceae bacterium]